MAKTIEEYELSTQDEESYKEFTSFYEQSEKKEKTNNTGILIKGKIVKINDDIVMVDIGQKAESKMNINEITDNDGNLIFKEGDEIELLLNDSKGKYRISYKQALKLAKTKEVIEKLKDDFQDKIIDVRIIGKNKGGFIVNWESEGVECFLPIKESALKPNIKINNKVIKVCIIKLNNSGIIVSRKKYFDISNKDREEKIEKMKKAESLQGKVVNVKDFGIFVSVDDIEGLVHSSEISHKNFVNPEKLYKVGDDVLVKFLNYDESKSKLSLSIKALTKDPWEDIENQLKVGYTIKAVVSSIQPYGTFIDIGNDIEGFLHITEISWEKNIKKPNNYLKIGQEIDVEIIELDPSNKKLRVSLKKLLDKPFIQFIKKYKEGDILNGDIATITDFGAFIRFGNIDGLLHNEDLSWNKQDKCKDVLKVGDNIEVKILKIDKENEKISLSRKVLLKSPTSIFAKSHKVGDVVSGNIVEIKDFGIFVQLDENMDALIKNEDLFPLKKDELKIGDKVEASIVNIDTNNSKIRLSVKKLARKKEQDEIKSYNNDEKMTLGDILKDRLK
ncbi:30S ribosomal protein S1 [Helicobacter sp. MIT 99-5507]|uniref:30S ribosomal protein S1 n=1 Tax=Helicobacter sp. MIT 99-5507 TaxID=152489 RepID=UPI000E1EF1B4|nr:30S ribosomal protein S1 [Helicobacter sp. MIT 99-5507]RDU58473.1 30S ribosomal protein S1 [Helicobacter sp. MIT 99-5507]